MSKEYDCVVFGATGFTGRNVCKELVRRLKSIDDETKIAFAGRSRKKLEDVVNWMMLDTSLSSFPMEDIGFLIADVTDEQSMLQMCKQAKIVLNCVGPFKFWGEAVVKSCLEGGSDYIDITGEPEYMERIKMKYHDEAITKGVYIINACGFDCVPSELGVIFAKEKFNGTLATVENYFAIHHGEKGMTGNFGTYSSIVNSVSDVSSLQKIRRAMPRNPIPLCGPKLKLKSIHYNARRGMYCLPFIGADASVVRRSQRFYFEEYKDIPVQFSMYISTSFASMISIMLFGLILKLLTLTSWGTNLMLNHPKFFTAGSFNKVGPTEQQMDETSFSFVMYCNGYKRLLNHDEFVESMGIKEPLDSEMIVKVSGPEIGYVFTSIAMVQSLLTLRDEREMLPLSGGVYTPGPAFKKTRMIEHLQKHGVKFEVVQ